MTEILSVQERHRLAEQEKERRSKDWTTWNVTRASQLCRDYSGVLTRQIVRTNRAYYTYHSSMGEGRSRYHKIFEIATLPGSHPFAETIHAHCVLIVYHELVWIEPTEGWTSMSFVHEEFDENNNPKVYVGIPDTQCEEVGSKIHKVFENTDWLKCDWVRGSELPNLRFRDRKEFEPFSTEALFSPDETKVYYDPYPHRFVQPSENDFILPCVI
ncbi:MAG: hypothetical protein NC084_04160 [Bacteroides sp.]|nr:hypothetical protein [Eubacterium sp.]MCM1417640.1 hypothetical protein [Roseburia sp.]MCM1461895.1 hypothetical protein [Bacteroides sp.]